MHNLTLPPQPPFPVGYIIDPVAFFIALIAGPLLFTAASFWVMLIPVFALGLGGPLYLAIGTPLLLWYLRRHDGNPNDLAVLALMVIGGLGLLASITALITQDRDALLGVAFYFGFGIIFAPIWAYFFGRVYQYLRRDFFAKPRNL
ncbi:hypothetical protein [Parasphingorhabdus sp.]|uniref:hypothetical protein n=1 Tax=Parasphingorhabdus sp. TaxID=2709688 RepID=UPI00329A4C16